MRRAINGGQLPANHLLVQALKHAVKLSAPSNSPPKHSIVVAAPAKELSLAQYALNGGY